MLDHFLSKSDQGKLRCRAAGSVSSQPTQLSGENGTKKCYDPINGDTLTGTSKAGILPPSRVIGTRVTEQ